MSTTDTRLTFRYLSEPDTIAAGVTDMGLCVDVMEETLRLVDARRLPDGRTGRELARLDGHLPRRIRP